MIDTSMVRVHQHAACIADNGNQAVGRSRGGLTSKLHVVVDGKGSPLRHLYRARNCIERFCNKIKRCRRTATGYDKVAANSLAFVQLASIRLWLRVYEFTT
jgi:hypothetical protein